MWRRGQQQQQGPPGSADTATGVSGAAAAAAVGLAAISTGDGTHSPAASHVALLAGHPRSSDECLQELAVASGSSASAGSSSTTRRSHTAVPLAEGVEGDSLLVGQQMLSSGDAVVQTQHLGIPYPGSSSSVTGQQGAVQQHIWSQVVGGGPLGESREETVGGMVNSQAEAAEAGSSSSRWDAASLN